MSKTNKMYLVTGAVLTAGRNNQILAERNNQKRPEQNRHILPNRKSHCVFL